MDISIPISKLNEALRELVQCDFDEDELRAECEHAIDNAIPADDNTLPLVGTVAYLLKTGRAF